MIAAFIGCALGAMTLTSCGSDDDNNSGGGGGDSKTTTPAYWVATITYTNLGTDTKDAVNLSVTCPDDNGKMQTYSGLENESSRTITFKSYTFGEEITTVNVKATAKESFTSTTKSTLVTGYDFKVKVTPMDANDKQVVIDGVAQGMTGVVNCTVTVGDTSADGWLAGWKKAIEKEETLKISVDKSGDTFVH